MRMTPMQAMHWMLIIAAAFIIGVMEFTEPHSPRLVAYGCMGAEGALYADEEDHFPACEIIERN